MPKGTFLSLLAAFRSSADYAATEAGRATERHRRIAVTALFTALARAIGFVAQLVTIPLVLSHLGQERFGIWMTIASFVPLLAFADLGVGNGLMSMVAQATGREDTASMQRYVASAYAVLTAIGGVFLGGFLLVWPHIDWPAFLKASSPLAKAEVAPAVLTVAITIAVGIPLSATQKVQLGLQRGHIAYLWQSVASVLGLLAVFLVISAGAGLPSIVLALTGVPMLAQAANLLTFLLAQYSGLRLRLSDITKGASQQIARIGGLFFTLQLGAALTYATDNLILTHILGPEAVTVFSVVRTLFSVVPTVLNMALLPLWPAYSEATARGDQGWVRSALRRSLFLNGMVAAAGALLLLLLATPILHLWLGGNVNAPPALLFWLCLWTTLDSVGNSIAMLLNGLNVMRFQILLSVFFVPICLGVKVWLTNWLGVSGVVAATFLTYLTIQIPAYYWFLRRRSLV